MKDETRTRLPDHSVPETHLTKEQRALRPGGDGDGKTDHKGTAQASSITGGAAGQQVGLPAPLPAKEAKEQGIASPSQEKALKEEAKPKTGAETEAGAEAEPEREPEREAKGSKSHVALG